MGRVDVILQKVRNRISDASAQKIYGGAILLEMDSVERDLCERCLAIPYDGDFNTEAGTELYDLGTKIYMLKNIIEPSTWRHRLQIITDIDKWADLKRRLTHHHAMQPLYVMVFNERLRMMPVPTKTGEVLKVFMYLYPSKQLEEGSDPQVPARFDDALLWGTLARYGVEGMELKYEAEVLRRANEKMKEVIDGVHEIDHWSSKLGF